MKLNLKSYILILFTSTIYSQDKINVLSNSKDTYIETYKYYSYNEQYSLTDAIRIGPSGMKILKSSISTAIKWVELNNNYNKQFTKEISRFKAIDKKTYDFYKKYIDQFADEYIITFYGYENGDFKVEIKKHNYDGFIIIDNIEMLKDFKNIINGKSANNEIDDIFKK
ncbi:hypothetical protein NAT47_00435 [Flavobacterium sp. HXWNR69]|uniref:DUF4252 domain-containing protein n=1 Tax=Flavobacterium fragile TaxID=2949085 RepID=A0ABT0TD30_9FLAO|nr:hypothetical protein [Flavobacterium sp. HXWNR69]MCL9768878.1 hypothetical protein [Flavobacterium sp. HXWNR69]